MGATLAHLLQQARRRFQPFSSTAGLDAQVLAAHILQRPRAFLAAHPEQVISDAQAGAFEQALRRIEAGEPLPYVVGHWEFFGLDLIVTPSVLIPRPETELLVETALRWMKQHRRYTVLDVGTGSGCIAIALAAHQPLAQVTALDISEAALQVAQANIQRHGLSERIRLMQADLLPPGPEQFDLVCANLPYIPSPTLETLPVLRYEPRLALDGGADGLDAVRRLLAAGASRLHPHAVLLLEIEAGQGEAALSLAGAVYPAAQVHLLPDLAGHDRLLVIQT
jgi:release factor glutamine methyltransferase